MRAYYIDERTDRHCEIDVKPELGSYYSLLDCDCIDIVIRWIDGHPYNVVVDGCWMLKERRITGHGLQTGENLHGSMLVFGVEDSTCELCSLDDEELSMLNARTIQGIFKDGSEHPVLWYSR